MAIIFGWLVLSLLVGLWAARRGHSGGAMMLISLLLSPLIGFIVEALRAPTKEAVEARQIAAGDMKKCPACAEFVRVEAVKCRYCGEPIAAQAPRVDAGVEKGW